MIKFNVKLKPQFKIGWLVFKWSDELKFVM